MDMIKLDGLTFGVEFLPDADAGAPWDNQDCLGIVSDWTRRRKAPGERVLNHDYRREHRRFYDFAAAVRNAKREGLKGPEAVLTAEREYDYLRGWCNDEWHYIGVVVTLLDVDGNKTDIFDSVWAVDNDGDYAKSIADDLVSDLHTQYGHLDELTTTGRIREAA